MSISCTLHLKVGGSIFIEGFSKPESDAREEVLQREWLKEVGHLPSDYPDIAARHKKHHPNNTPTEIVELAPSYAARKRLFIHIREITRQAVSHIRWLIP